MGVAPKRMSAPRWCLEGLSKTHTTKYPRKTRHVLYIKLGRHVLKENLQKMEGAVRATCMDIERRSNIRATRERGG
jgi:hypothetical protein